MSQPGSYTYPFALVPRRTLPLGRVLATPGAVAALAEAQAAVLLDRHVRGDWGTLDAHDRAANDDALLEGGRLLSAYTLRTGETVWVLTGADRAHTVVLLPSEYDRAPDRSR